MSLTINDLKEAAPGSILRTGRGLYPSITHGRIKWVAVRGRGFHDWAIYYDRVDQDEYDIATRGDKIYDLQIAGILAGATPAALRLYRR